MTYKSFRRIHAVTSSPSTHDIPDMEISGYNHPTVSSDVSMYTLDPASMTDQDFLAQMPQLDSISQDGYTIDPLGYYGMDIGTWIGLDNMRWDGVQETLQSLQ